MSSASDRRESRELGREGRRDQSNYVPDILARFLAYVGLRLGETAALKVSGSDFEKRIVSVLQTWRKMTIGRPGSRIPKSIGTQASCNSLFPCCLLQKVLYRETIRSLRLLTQTRKAPKY